MTKEEARQLKKERAVHIAISEVELKIQKVRLERVIFTLKEDKKRVVIMRGK